MKPDNNWYEVCLQCTHSYTTKDDEDELKCRCRKGCHFDDVGLKRGIRDEQSRRNSR